MTTKRRTYTDEFKREAVRSWQTTGKSAAAIEAELGISHGLLNKWKGQLKAEGGNCQVNQPHSGFRAII